MNLSSPSDLGLPAADEMAKSGDDRLPLPGAYPCVGTLVDVRREEAVHLAGVLHLGPRHPPRQAPLEHVVSLPPPVPRHVAEGEVVTVLVQELAVRALVLADKRLEECRRQTVEGGH